MGRVDVRSKIHEDVAAIKPHDIIEAQHIHFVLDWIKSGREIFRIEKPATPDTHLVSYFVIVSPDIDQMLLVDHKKAELWLPAGGHVEPEEDPKETAIREAKEELGIDADFLLEEPLMLTVNETVGNSVKHTDVSFWYVLKGDPSKPLDYDPEEFHQIRWFAINEIPFEKSDPHLKRFIDKLFHHMSLVPLFG